VAEPVAETVELATSPALRPYVLSMQGYRYEGFAAGQHRGLPSADLTFIISLSEPVELLALPDRRQSPRAVDAFVAGLHANHAIIGHDGHQHGISLQPTPAGARALFGLPARGLAREVVDLESLAGPSARVLVERLRDQTWAQRAGALETFLLSRLDDGRTPRPELSWAWRLMWGSHGAIDVSGLAATVGWNRRHLARRFQDEFGLGPKLAGRVMRFARSKRMLATGRVHLADIAAACGYYDQAHMARDWREFAGCPPTAWAHEEALPIVGASGAAAGPVS